MSATPSRHKSDSNGTSAQAVAASIINNTLANAAIHVSSAAYDPAHNQVVVSEIINSTLASSALNLGGSSSSNAASNSLNQQEKPITSTNSQNNPTKDTSHENLINTAIEAASTLFNIPKTQISFVNISSSTSGPSTANNINKNTTAATNKTFSSNHDIQTAGIILDTTVNAAVNAASTVFNLPKSQIKVVGASTGGIVSNNHNTTTNGQTIAAAAAANPAAANIP